MTEEYIVRVSDQGTVYSGQSMAKARKWFAIHKSRSLVDYGKGSYKDVFLLLNGEIIDEHTEHICIECNSDCGHTYRGYCILDECDICEECIENCECVEED